MAHYTRLVAIHWQIILAAMRLRVTPPTPDPPLSVTRPDNPIPAPPDTATASQLHPEPPGRLLLSKGTGAPGARAIYQLDHVSAGPGYVNISLSNNSAHAFLMRY